MSNIDISAHKEKNERNKEEKFPIQINGTFPKHRHEVLNINGWGFKDSFFTLKNGHLTFTGNRYSMCNIPFKNARQHLLQLFNYDIINYKPHINPIHTEKDYPPSIENQAFVEALKNTNIDYSLDFNDRFFRCHGQSTRDFYILRYSKFQRIPDLVVWPKNHDDVVLIVKLANKHFSVLIPFGGGTNTTLSLNYTKKDSNRFYVSLDTSLMNRILWIDKESMLACIESGITGFDLSRALEKHGFTMGHEPDSIEFSTLGGWVATRSSGMKQQTYGNIEDIVMKITFVTSIGVMEKNFIAPRCSIGPNFDHVVMGSEGTLGVITKVVIKLHKFPSIRRFGSIIFPDFELGIKFMYDVSKFSQKPSNLRLIDNKHFQLGQVLRHNKTFMGDFIDLFKKHSVSIFFQYKMSKVALGTYLIEGEKDDVNAIETKLKKTAWKYWGISAGKKYGERAYLMTLTVCYIRDFFFDMGFLFDSIEPSVSWSKSWSMINAIMNVWKEETGKRNIFNILALRISQIYNNGVCVYFYYGIGPTTEYDQLQIFEELTNILRKAILTTGGNLSHHHGVGKKSSKWYPASVSRVGVDVFNAIKSKVDPKNVFDVGNLVEDKSRAKL
ncbi:hypothetical protein PVAND_007180 [Polypedilum vanderplanki]|uniref:Alkylglycerone-phosphate synthase n=1 Tax=Polypedilum vanderplanki TaxID=319348 RepID=A0A9J6C723_POLVA|nr:hypothetical protein PVAND_007180 [Polypedilum vanderplanki]